MKELIVRMEDNGQLTPVAELVRCKDCVKRGDITKCVVARLSSKHAMPMSDFDNNGEWYCAEGKPKGT